MSTWSTFEFKLFTKKRLTQEQVDKILDLFDPGELDGYALPEQPMEVRRVMEREPPAPAVVVTEKPPTTYQGPLVVTDALLEASSAEQVTEIVQGPEAWNLFLLIEEDRQLFRLFPRNPKLWEKFKGILQGILQVVGPRYVHRAIKPEVVYSACAEIESNIKSLVNTHAFPEMRAWVDTFEVRPVKLANPDELSRNPFSPRLVPYDRNPFDPLEVRDLEALRLKGPHGD